MVNFRISFFFLSSQTVFSYHRSASAFLMAKTTTTTPSNASTSFVLRAGFEQLPGESSTAFIKRITSQSDDYLDQQKAKTNNLTMPSSRKNSSNDDEETDGTQKPKGKYQRIEEWDAEKKENGELSWEEKVQFEGQRFGNQVRQDSILRRHLGTFF